MNQKVISAIVSSLKEKSEKLHTKYDLQLSGIIEQCKSTSETINDIENNWVGKWLDPTYCLYRRVGGEGVVAHMESEILCAVEEGCYVSYKALSDETESILSMYINFREEVVTELSVVSGIDVFHKEEQLIIDLDAHVFGYGKVDFNVRSIPRILGARMLEAEARGLNYPPHIAARSIFASILSKCQACVEFGKMASRVLRQIEIKVMSVGGAKRPTVEVLDQVLLNFHRFARQLRNRHDKRETIVVHDEYDVQDLLHALLRLHFDDVRPEEWTPSYAGKASRMDFLLKRERIVVEVKKTREGLANREVGDQLVQDVVRYKEHTDCRLLYCFVYDPESRIGNPHGVASDLEKLSSEELEVKVMIVP